MTARAAAAGAASRTCAAGSRVTLRLRLAIALVALATVGLTIFGVVTYTLYARSQYQRLDDQIRSSVPLVSMELAEELGPNGPDGQAAERPERLLVVRPYRQPADLGDQATAATRSRRLPAQAGAASRRAPTASCAGATAGLEASLAISDSSARPALPADLQESSPRGRFFTTGSVEGDGRWRVDVGAERSVLPHWSTVVAVPSDEVRSSLQPPGAHRGRRPASACSPCWAWARG